MNRLERIKGCLLGGAVGDALGAAVEFLDWPAIEAKFGPQGIVDFSPAFGITGAITDDTQMMLFTAEGLLRAYVCSSSRGICHVPSIIHHALLRWLMTQDYPTAIPISTDGWLIEQPDLWSRRAPGTTCLNALKVSPRLGAVAENNSKGCGAVMRVAPCAFFANAFDYAAQSGRLTHGHPSGYLAAGLFADILQRMVDQQDSLEHAITESLAKYGQEPGMEEVRNLIERVLFFYYEGYQPTPQRIDELGGGWVAEESLAIGLWCALMASSFEEGVITAVNHGGDSDSTGLIAGHLLGAQYGAAAIPVRWFGQLELREVIEQMAEDIERVPRDYCGYGGEFDQLIEQMYPGG
ncbi:crystallin J1 [Pseudomonas helleri]|uniref:ADP-ribosylglycohydrolase family protein n=1 Tax=Pseudomonas helleri TaxID=1608996 RepID=UPI000652D81A|nr:ADP-ribosylglycohydrolase family protein [Pseudomonas helleri]KMN24585.1 crystallin J1 [Pseudomonas helleri]